MPARNTLIQLLAYPVHQPREPECTASQTDRQTDRQTDDRITPIADHTVTHCVAVRSV